MNKFLRSSVAGVLIVTTSLWSVAAVAAPIAPETALTTQAVGAVSQERAQVVTWLQREDVRNQMARLGVSGDQAVDRVAALSDDEIHSLAGKLDQAQVAGDAGASVLGTIVFIFLVLLVTDILGLTKVFPFTRSIR